VVEGLSLGRCFGFHRTRPLHVHAKREIAARRDRGAGSGSTGSGSACAAAAQDAQRARGFSEACRDPAHAAPKPRFSSRETKHAPRGGPSEGNGEDREEFERQLAFGGHCRPLDRRFAGDRSRCFGASRFARRSGSGIRGQRASAICHAKGGAKGQLRARPGPGFKKRWGTRPEADHDGSDLWGSISPT